LRFSIADCRFVSGVNILLTAEVNRKLPIGNRQ
jgi:hypothetical protein